jgi:tripartite-type tricarboxylate transporter receptor subunit TctC
MRPILALFQAAFAAVLVLLAGSAAAQDAYPSRPITLIVGYAPGGVTDVTARIIAEYAGRELGQPIVVKNMPGVNGILGIGEVKRAKADGYTLLFGGSTHQVFLPLMDPKIPYDPVKDFKIVSPVSNFDWIVVTSPESGIKTFDQLVEALKKPGNHMTYPHAGTATPYYLNTKVMVHMVGGDAEPIQYKGAGPALIDVVSHRLSFGIDTVSSLRDQIANGKLIPLATTSPVPHEGALASIPTYEKLGYPKLAHVNWSTWNSILAPSAVPQDVIRKLNAAVAKALQNPQLVQRFQQMGLRPMTGYTPEKAAAFVAEQVREWGPLLKAANVSLEN